MTFQGRPPGSAWNGDGVPIKIAIAISVLYCAYVGVYVAYKFAAGRRSTTWNSISDLAALALGLMPPEGEGLEHTSAGIKRVENFRKGISVGSSGRLGLEFRGEGKGLKYWRVVLEWLIRALGRRFVMDMMNDKQSVLLFAG
jgi:hypothetical protein